MGMGDDQDPDNRHPPPWGPINDGVWGGDPQYHPDTQQNRVGMPPCYVRGTRIRTSSGVVAVERLQIGDQIATHQGAPAAVRWIGHRSVQVTGHPDPRVVWPILVTAHAFAPGQPSRDLFVSPGHALHVDGVLIQAEKLVNGATIRQVPRDHVEYWHVELDVHSIMFAEDLPAESYLDTGNRTNFVNGGEFLSLHPDFLPRHWADTCVPLVLEGPEILQARARLLTRALELGHAMTADADPHLDINGVRIEPVWLSATRVAFMLPAEYDVAALRSRHFVPTHFDSASKDPRTLGIHVGRLQLDGSDRSLDEVTGAGWHDCEWDEHGTCARWTSGDTPLPAGIRLLVVDLAGRGRYWLEALKPVNNVFALVGAQ